MLTAAIALTEAIAAVCFSDLKAQCLYVHIKRGVSTQQSIAMLGANAR